MIPTHYEVFFTTQARRNLRGINDYIAQDSALNASKMIAALLDSIEKLESFPHRYDFPRSRPIRARDVRSMPVTPYLVRYKIDESRRIVHIQQIRHGARR